MPLRFAAIVFGLFLASQSLADSVLTSLSNNPFTRPQILKPKPPPKVPVDIDVPIEEIDLKISATMVSDQSPMAVVDGNLVAVGDSVRGFKLVRVEEGRAMFVRGGRKYSFDIQTDNDGNGFGNYR